MKITVSPTRMELLRLQKRLSIAVRGHKLLKDKLEGLIQEFLPIVEEYKKMRLEVDRELPRVMRMFILARIASDRQTIESALVQSQAPLKLSFEQRRVMSVLVPSLSVEFGREGAGYSFLDTPADLDSAISDLREYFPKLVSLAELEQTIWLLSLEIEKTRRRVNALEYVLIPQIRESLKYIRSKLEELERSNITRLMKVKEIIASGKET